MPDPKPPDIHRAWVAVLLGLVAVLIAAGNWGGKSIAISGDEPHYLMVVNSLLQDKDLDLTEDYARVARGGFEAGQRFRGAGLDHHTVLVDRVHGGSKLWQEVFDWRVRECNGPGCEGWRRLTRDFLPGEPRSEVSAHPVAFPAFLALFLSPWGLSPAGVERGVNVLVALMAWLGVCLTYACGRAAGFKRWEALLATALLGLASPWLPYARSFFVELPAGFFLLLGLHALQIRRPSLAGFAAGIAFAFKPPFIVFGLGWMLERLWAGQKRQALQVGIPLGAVGLTVGVVNRLSANRWVISGTSPWESANGLSGLHANLFDAAHGLVPFAPWIALTLVAWAAACMPSFTGPPLERQIALPATLYLALLSANAYLGATCYGPRYWIAVLPLLAVLAVSSLRNSGRGRASLALFIILGGLGSYTAITGVLHYPTLWDRPAVSLH